MKKMLLQHNNFLPLILLSKHETICRRSVRARKLKGTGSIPARASTTRRRGQVGESVVCADSDRAIIRIKLTMVGLLCPREMRCAMISCVRQILPSSRLIERNTKLFTQNAETRKQVSTVVPCPRAGVENQNKFKSL